MQDCYGVKTKIIKILEALDKVRDALTQVATEFVSVQEGLNVFPNVITWQRKAENNTIQRLNTAWRQSCSYYFYRTARIHKINSVGLYEKRLT